MGRDWMKLDYMYGEPGRDETGFDRIELDWVRLDETG